MTQFTPSMEAELAKGAFIVFGALRIDLPGAMIRLLDGSAELEVFPGETFVGRDPDYGVLAAVDALEDGMGDEAPTLSFTLHPASDAAKNTLTDPAGQLSRVRLWLCAIDRTTGAIIADPLLMRDVEIDQTPATIGAAGKREVDVDCVSSMDRFFDNDEGFRLSDANHQRIWPGEKGLANMSGLVKKIYWGMATPAGAATGGAAGGGSGAGAGGGFNLRDPMA